MTVPFQRTLTWTGRQKLHHRDNEVCVIVQRSGSRDRASCWQRGTIIPGNLYLTRDHASWTDLRCSQGQDEGHAKRKRVLLARHYEYVDRCIESIDNPSTWSVYLTKRFQTLCCYRRRIWKSVSICRAGEGRRKKRTTGRKGRTRITI